MSKLSLQSPLSEHDKLYYTRGYCHLLALALVEAGAGEPWAVASETSLSTWEHMFVRVGPLCFDATGLHHPRPFLRMWRPLVPQAVLVKEEGLILAMFKSEVTERERATAEKLLTWQRAL